MRKTTLVVIFITVLLIVIGASFIYKTYETVYDKVKEVDTPGTENVTIGPNQVVYFSFNLLQGQADIHIKQTGNINELYKTDFYTSRAGSYKYENSGSTQIEFQIFYHINTGGIVKSHVKVIGDISPDNYFIGGTIVYAGVLFCALSITFTTCDKLTDSKTFFRVIGVSLVTTGAYSIFFLSGIVSFCCYFSSIIILMGVFFVMLSNRVQDRIYT